MSSSARTYVPGNSTLPVRFSTAPRSPFAREVEEVEVIRLRTVLKWGE